jgi:7-cyano-7-deazaguanine synthase
MAGASQAEEPRKAVVLLSGGLDSATTLAMARSDGYRVYALSVRYGQRHETELAAARRIAAAAGVERHVVLDLDLRQFGGSALTDDVPVPKGEAAEGRAGEIPVTYVPARNTIFLSLALAWAEVLEADAIFIGINALDYSGYPDCRPEFLEAYQRMADLATRTGVERRRPPRIHAPLLRLTKAEIIRRGLALGLDPADTISCYDPSSTGAACGECAACRLRLRGFAEAGVADPAIYDHSRRSPAPAQRLERR